MQEIKEFLTQNLTWIIPVVAVVVFAIKAVTTLKKAKRIDAEGVETDAVVSKVVEQYDPEYNSSSYTTYVEYKDEDGVRRESPIAVTSRVEYEKGDQVRIRFIPGDYKMVRPAKE